MSRYTIVIDARGAGANIYVIVAKAVAHMKTLGHTRDEVDELKNKVFSARSYREACDAVREWFPIQFEEDEDEGSVST